MATRLYLPVSGAPAVSPAINADWANNTGSPSRIAMVLAKSNTALTASSSSNGTTGTLFLRQYVSPQIGVVNFNGTTVSLVLKCTNGGTTAVQKLRVNIRLYHPDGTFTTLLSAADFDSIFVSAAQTRIINASSLANVTSQNGDYIVVEIGSNITTSGGLSTSETFGDPTGTADYALTSGLTTSLDPWVEFSAAIPAPQNTQFFVFFPRLGE